jgi:hypothetical protein
VNVRRALRELDLVGENGVVEFVEPSPIDEIA